MMTLLAAFKRKAAIFLVALALLVAVSMECGIGAEAFSTTMDGIVRAWHEREARFHFGEFVVEEVRFMGKGAIQQEGEPASGPGLPRPAQEAVPPNDNSR